MLQSRQHLHLTMGLPPISRALVKDLHCNTQARVTVHRLPDGCRGTTAQILSHEIPPSEDTARHRPERSNPVPARGGRGGLERCVTSRRGPLAPYPDHLLGLGIGASRVRLSARLRAPCTWDNRGLSVAHGTVHLRLPASQLHRTCGQNPAHSAGTALWPGRTPRWCWRRGAGRARRLRGSGPAGSSRGNPGLRQRWLVHSAAALRQLISARVVPGAGRVRQESPRLLHRRRR
mmetsp:Transcript_3911/g.11762  ORF Transcript_3911/g.11762 Transcript_3911/m.11762 type:complete len:233 (-) Transcript_3911:298-996(-)